MRPCYCDESIWIPVADGLERRGWEVHTARGELILGDSDRAQLAYAVEHDWLFVTFDDDFLPLVETDGLDHPGILFVHQAGRTIGEVEKVIDGSLTDRDPDDRRISYL